MKMEEGNDSLDSVIRQAIGREPFLSFSRPRDSPVQWLQLLQALDKQEVSGWPFVSPLKVQLQKCEKCSREFCSTINYRRHLRVHHRLKKLAKDFIKDRELLRVYWDKLSVEEEKEAVSFNNVMLEEVPGSSVINALTTLIRKPGFSSLPHCYLKAGSVLLDIIQARPSRFPISSQELLSILDDASERTFLCGAPGSVQKYIFDGEAGTLGLETKNLIACASFLVEQKLVKEWLVDKDAEALRCQKLLMEEEEAAQKRQAELLERKRRKKLRQKEQKAKEKRTEDFSYAKDDGISSSEEALSPAEALSPSTMHHSEANTAEKSLDCIPLSVNTIHCPNACNGEDSEPQSGFSSEFVDHSTDENIFRQTEERHGHGFTILSQHQLLPKSNRAMTRGYHAHNSQISKLGAPRKSWQRDQRLSAPTTNGYRRWSRKSNTEMDESISHVRTQTDQNHKPDHTENGEVRVISVTFDKYCQPECNPAESQDQSMIENKPRQNSVHLKPVKTDSLQCGSNRSTAKLWRPVSRQGLKASISENDVREAHIDAIGRKESNQIMLEDFRSGITDDNTNTLAEESMDIRIAGFSSLAAGAFLVQTWEETMLSEHVKLVLSRPSESQSGHEMENHEQACSCCDIHDSIGNGSINMETLEGTSSKAAKSKFFIKPEKSLKVKYIPKLKTAT